MWSVDLIGFVLCVTAVLLMAADFSYRYKENIGNTIPVAYAALGLFMYAFAITGFLRCVFIVAFLYIAINLFYMVKKGDLRAERLAYLRKSLVSPGVICLMAAAVIIGFLTSELAFSWWDDINFWSQDAKQIFYLNGFAGKYGNVSPEFGDYPPAGSLYKCLFLFAGLGKYRENLQFLGYFVTNLIFMLPLFEMVRKAADKFTGGKKTALTIAYFVAMLLSLDPGLCP